MAADAQVTIKFAWLRRSDDALPEPTACHNYGSESGPAPALPQSAEKAQRMIARVIT
jgi:hypothetical protein